MHPLASRVLHLLRLGATSAPADDSGAVQTVQVQMSGTEIRDGVPVPFLFGFSACLPPGAKVLVGHLKGDRSQPTVLASTSDARPRNMAPGDVCLWDARGQSVTLTSGKIHMVTPRLEVTGDIIDNCASQSTTLAQFRQDYDQHTHPGNGTTDHPA